MTVLAVILAAGGGSRFRGPQHKLTAELDGRLVIEHAIDAAVQAAIGPVLVVTGAVDLDDVVEQYGTAPADGNERVGVEVSTIRNADWADGQATSLQLAVREADRRGAEAIVVGLGDQPFIAPESWRAVAAAAAPIGVADYDGLHRNPVKLHRSIWPELPSTGDEGARAFVRLNPHLVQPVPCRGSAADIDTREDLQSWQNRSSTNSP